MIKTIKETPREFLSEIIEKSSDAIITFDRNLNICFFNKSSELLFGYDEEEFLQKNLNDLLPPDIKEKHNNHIKSFDKSPENSRTMGSKEFISGRSKHGVLIPLNITIQKHPSSGQFKYTVICRDITNWVHAKKEIKLAKDRFSRAQNLTNIGNWEWDITTGEVIWSEQVYKIFGHEPDSFSPTYEAFLEAIHPQDRDLVSKTVNDCVENLKPYKIIHRVLCPDGTQKMVEEIGDLQIDDQGHPVKMNGNIQDITENWDREKKLIEAIKKAEEASHSKRQFLATMSHELRTPLNAIIGFSSLMAEETLGACAIPQHVEYSNAILNSGNHLLSIISNILDIAKIDLEKLTVNPSHFNMENLIQECLYVINHLALKKEIKLDFSLADGFPKLYLDCSFCLQILINLITNAIKFSDEGSTVHINLDFDNKSLFLTVHDEGIGISEEVQKTIWEPFTQADMQITRHYEGSGLGLAIVKGLTEIQEGVVHLESKLGVGATFKIKLPLRLN